MESAKAAEHVLTVAAPDTWTQPSQTLASPRSSLTYGWCTVFWITPRSHILTKCNINKWHVPSQPLLCFVFSSSSLLFFLGTTQQPAICWSAPKKYRLLLHNKLRFCRRIRFYFNAWTYSSKSPLNDFNTMFLLQRRGLSWLPLNLIFTLMYNFLWFGVLTIRHPPLSETWIHRSLRFSPRSHFLVMSVKRGSSC